jgi:hypothetical protein
MAPRIVLLHHLDLIPNVAVAALLALAPAAVWIHVAARSRARSPVLALPLVSLCWQRTPDSSANQAILGDGPRHSAVISETA